VPKIPFAFGAKKIEHLSNSQQVNTCQNLLFHCSSMGYMNVFAITHGCASAGGGG